MTQEIHQGPIVVAALYHFAPLPDFAALQLPLTQLAEAQGIKGTLLLASEGINGTVSGSREAIDALLAWLRQDDRLANLEHKESYYDEQPFYRLKVRLKKEIVTLGVPGIDPNEQVGTYVSPREWNELLADPEVVVVDTRNDYEVAVGTFEGAVDPHTRTFREFPDFVKKEMDPGKQKKVAMFCTGGIRCEKASALMLAEGFEEVFHLKGGILKYLEEVPEAESRWQGECFVFDERVAVGHGLAPGTHSLCRGCRMPLSPADLESPDYQEGVSCSRCIDELTPEKKARLEERHRQSQLAAARNERHVGRVDDRGREVS